MRLVDVDEALRLFGEEYEKTKELIHKCMKSFETMCADDFCSYGERKDGGDG